MTSASGEKMVQIVAYQLLSRKCYLFEPVENHVFKFHGRTTEMLEWV